MSKKIFGDDHIVEYDCIPNHDVYSFLRVKMEVPRNQDTKSILILNGNEVGEIVANRQNKRKTSYSAYRYKHPNNRAMCHLIKADFQELGRAMAAIITDMVR